MIIPKGKEVKIAANGKNILNDKRMFLSSEITLSLTSSFQHLLGDQSNNALTVLGVVSGVTESLTGKGFTGKFAELGYQIWTSTEPVRFSFEVLFNMITNAKTDVLEPAKILMNLPLPIDKSKTKEGGIGLKAPGPSIVEALNKEAKYSKRYSFRCGSFYLHNIIIKTVEPTFSSDVDENGFPIWCQLKIDVESLFTATQDQINNFGYSNKEQDL
jgi:hypothetical protein